MKAASQSLPLAFVTEARVESLDWAERTGACSLATVPLPPRTSAGAEARCRSLRIVGILAFCQSLLFLLLWLFLCAHAGAAPKAVADLKPELVVSTYQPLTQRDPFLPAAPKLVLDKGATDGPVALNLQGILYDAASPAAMVNDQLVMLNKATTVHVGRAAVEIKAIEITRERVLIEVAGQKTELRIAAQRPPKEIKE